MDIIINTILIETGKKKKNSKKGFEDGILKAYNYSREKGKVLKQFPVKV